ncbi:MAG: hypothetical protein ACXWT1_11300 [Methylobacter sp.]
MPITETALKAIDDTLKALDPAISSLRNRKDFNVKEAPFNVSDMVVFFQGFQQGLLKCKAKDEQAGVEILAADTEKSVLPKINEVMLSNTTLSNMQPLNTKRTIEPKQALEQNVIFEKLLQASMQLVASGHAPEQQATVTVAIRSITYTSRHHGGGNKLLRPNGQATYWRWDNQNIQTDLNQSGGNYNNAEWDIGRGGDGASEPFSQTMNTAPAVTIVCRVAAQGGNVTVNGFAGQLNGAPWVYAGTQMLTNNFQIGLNQKAVNPNVQAVVNNGTYTDFTVTFTGAQSFPNEVGAATLALTLTAQTDAGNVAATANAAGSVYLTFGAPGGAVQSLVANDFTLDVNRQDVTPARLALAIRAVRLGRNAIQAGGGVLTATGGVPNFAFGTDTDCVDAIFLFLKSRGITFSLGYRWVPGVNNTGLNLIQAPPLHTYLWMSLSPSGINAPPGLPNTEAWAECHNLAVAFALMGEILGLTPFVIDYGQGGGNQLGYAVDYPQPRRQDAYPHNAQNAPNHGLLAQSYSRMVTDPNGNQGRQQLCFIDQNNGVNNFEGVTVFNNVRLYPLGECILAENNRGHNADNYYCYYTGNPDYVVPPNVPVSFDNQNGLVPLVFAGDWVRWFFNYGVAYGWNWQNGYDPVPYPGVVVPFQCGTTPGCFMWEN